MGLKLKGGLKYHRVDKDIINKSRKDLNDESKGNYKDCIEKWHQLSKEEKQAWQDKRTAKNPSGFGLFIDNCLTNEENEHIKKLLPHIDVNRDGDIRR